MNDYQTQAKQFLADCNATMEIKYLCKTNPTWDEKLHNCYWFTITTPKGKYSGKFYDSLHNTEISICLLRIMVVSTIREIRWTQHSTRKTNGEKNCANSRQKQYLMSMMYLLVLRSTAMTASVTSVPSSVTAPTVFLQGKLSLLAVRNM